MPRIDIHHHHSPPEFARTIDRLKTNQQFQTDTSRAIASLILSGTTSRYPDIRFIFPHAGGTIPYMVERLTWWVGARKDIAELVPNGVLAELQKFFYDTAFSANPHTFASLLKLVPPSQILLGSDFPFRRAEEHTSGLATCGLSSADIQAIEHDNALRLLPGLARKLNNHACPP